MHVKHDTIATKPNITLMFSRAPILIFILLYCLSSLLCLGVSSSDEVSNLRKPQLITPKNPNLTISLPTNTSTGYSWHLDEYDADIMTPLSQSFASSSNSTLPLVGVPGITTWKFKVHTNAFHVPNVTKVVLRYSRDWSSDHGERKVIWVFISNTE